MPPSCSLSLRSFFLALPFVLVGRSRSALPSLSFHPRLKMWHSTGLLRCLRWCGIRAGLPRRGVHRGNDAQIGRIISKTTTLCLQPSSYCLFVPSDFSFSLFLALGITCLFARSPPFHRWPLVPSLSFLLVLVLSSSTVARDGIQPPLSAPPPNNHPATAACHRARRRVTESSDYYLICWHEQHATLLPLPARSRRSLASGSPPEEDRNSGTTYLSPRVQRSSSKTSDMTTTTGDPSTLKSPASLSGGDLVSRLLAATPPYLYNVPLTPHSFFFSEMLRSFVQAKTEVSSASNTTSAPRRRKRSWRDARDRPLELTTKERQHHHHHHHHSQQQQQQQPPDKYFHAQQQPQQAETRLENGGKQSDGYDPANKVGNFEQKPSFAADILKPVDENKSEFSKQSKSFFDHERPRHFEQAQPPENIFSSELQKVKPEESHSSDRKNCNYNDRSPYDDRTKSAIGNQELPPLLPDQKKLDFSRNFLPSLPGRGCDMLPGVKGFGLPGNVTNPEFLPSPLWYPPYPMPQSYPGIDPLHFFIDLRVSGHIWDRKLSERQLPFKGKHCSAFSVPQSKEYNSNRPLNLTRDEACTSRSSEENLRGTNYILRHLTRTYRDISQARKATRSETSTSGESEDSSKDVDNNERSPKSEDISVASTSPEEERKDLRALIGLELVVDYVKEPKADASTEQTSQVTE